MAVVVNPNNPNGGSFDVEALPDLLEANSRAWVLVDEAFVDFVDGSVVQLVPEYDSRLVARRLSKTHGLAGFRVGYTVATLGHETKVRDRIERLRPWTEELVDGLRSQGVTTCPTETYLFLADLSPHDAGEVATRLRERVVEGLAETL
ncbi:aminotransferase class I/II-fold pyridoxal phosphate-dependent enzyme [Salinigranum marinum]|uniref:aminotransferase class I/II-fold pyridoxal phosphate-dependent enzyme n=1 Tax=Salinigranum marinum TaxID=1515595 RepID=UPI002989FA84|nr:aminotransferase class I/II-fold pyridoxal phosphate-dependent enzyme [Salinigranum marinum]